MSMKPIAVLGVGPAGLLAAHAVAMSGRPVTIFAAPGGSGKPEPSKINGAQFLHTAIPGIHESDRPDGRVQIIHEGDKDTYRRKVYGDSPDIPFVSFGVDRFIDAWQMSGTYEALWGLLDIQNAANVKTVDANFIQEALNKNWFERIVSSIPATAIFKSPAEHKFLGQTISIWPYCAVPNLKPSEEDFVLYDGTEDRSWSRTSMMFGYGGTEFGEGMDKKARTAYHPLISVRKPISNSCTCFPEVLRVGRMGTWTKGVLAHDGFFATLKMIMELDR